jgi:hypothetical protein
MIAAGSIEDSESRSGDSREQQREAEELKKEAPGLLDAAAVMKLGSRFSGVPEAKSRDDVAALRAVEEIKGDNACGVDSNEPQQFAQAEVEKVH